MIAFALRCLLVLPIVVLLIIFSPWLFVIAVIMCEVAFGSDENSIEHARRVVHLAFIKPLRDFLGVLPMES